jgi:hypothetical protein
MEDGGSNRGSSCIINRPSRIGLYRLLSLNFTYSHFLSHVFVNFVHFHGQFIPPFRVQAILGYYRVLQAILA